MSLRFVRRRFARWLAARWAPETLESLVRPDEVVDGQRVDGPYLHLVAVYAGQMKLYINGECVFPPQIGFFGYIDDYAVYHKPLSPDRVREHSGVARLLSGQNDR